MLLTESTVGKMKDVSKLSKKLILLFFIQETDPRIVEEIIFTAKYSKLVLNSFVLCRLSCILKEWEAQATCVTGGKQLA